MGFSVPPRLRSERWALTPPFHPYHSETQNGGLFSVALSVGMPRGIASRVYLAVISFRWFESYAASYPMVFGTFLPRLAPGAILRPSKIKESFSAKITHFQDEFGTSDFSTAI